MKHIIKKDLLSGFLGYEGWHLPNCLFPIETVFLKVSGWNLLHLPRA